MRSSYVFLLLLYCMFGLFALPVYSLAENNDLKLAVLDFTAINTTHDISVMFSDHLRSVLVKRNLTIIEKNNVQKVFEEIKYQQSGATSQDDAVKIGKLLNANKMLFGKLTRIGKEYVVNASMVEVETGKVERSDMLKIPSVEEFPAGAERIADRLTGTNYYYAPKDVIFGKDHEFSPFIGAFVPLNYSLGTTHGGSLYYGMEYIHWKGSWGVGIQGGNYTSSAKFGITHRLIKDLGRTYGTLTAQEQALGLTPVFVELGHRTKYLRLGAGIGCVLAAVSEKYIIDGTQESFSKNGQYYSGQVFGEPVYKNFGLRISYSFTISGDDSFYIRDFGGFGAVLLYRISL